MSTIIIIILAALAAFFAVAAKVLSDELDRHVADAKALGLLMDEIKEGKALTDRRCYHLSAIYHELICQELSRRENYASMKRIMENKQINKSAK